MDEATIEIFLSEIRDMRREINSRLDHVAATFSRTMELHEKKDDERFGKVEEKMSAAVTMFSETKAGIKGGGIVVIFLLNAIVAIAVGVAIAQLTR